MSSVEPTQPITDTPEPSPSQEPSPEPSSPQPTTPPASSVEPTQEPTQPPSSPNPPPSSSNPPPSSSPAPESSQQQPATQPPPSSNVSPAQSPAQSAAPSASPSPDAQSDAPTSVAAASSAVQSDVAQPSAIASISELTSAVDVTTTEGSGRVVTSRPPLVTQQVTSTDANGQVYTVTQIVHNPTAGNDRTGSGSDGSSGFFDNTGAVAGTFVVVGLAVTAGVMAFIIFMLRRRRRQRLDRDVAAAAAAAASASRGNFDDDDVDEKNNVAMTSFGSGGYYGAATDIHGQPQPNMGQYDYEDPAGGYDHYAASLPQPGDRTSTATAAGLAGFGAQSAQNSYGNQQPETGYAQDSYEHLADPLYNAVTTDGNPHQQQGAYYFDPKDAGAYDYSEDAYGGYGGEQEGKRQQMGHQRSGSGGSIARNDGGEGRGLKVTNV